MTNFINKIYASLFSISLLGAAQPDNSIPINPPSIEIVRTQTGKEVNCKDLLAIAIKNDYNHNNPNPSSRIEDLKMAFGCYTVALANQKQSSFSLEDAYLGSRLAAMELYDLGYPKDEKQRAALEWIIEDEMNQVITIASSYRKKFLDELKPGDTPIVRIFAYDKIAAQKGYELNRPDTAMPRIVIKKVAGYDGKLNDVVTSVSFSPTKYDTSSRRGEALSMLGGKCEPNTCLGNVWAKIDKYPDFKRDFGLIADGYIRFVESVTEDTPKNSGED